MKKSSNTIGYRTTFSLTIIFEIVTLIATMLLANTLQKAWWLIIFGTKIPKPIRATETWLWTIVIAGAVCSILSLLIAGVIVGQRDETGRIKLNVFDRFFSELHIVGFILSLLPIWLVASGMFYVLSSKWVLLKEYKTYITDVVLSGESTGGISIADYDTESIFSTLGYSSLTNSDEFAWAGLTSNLLMVMLALAALVAFAVSNIFLLTIIKKVKAGQFFATSFVGRIMISIGRSMSASVIMTVKVVGVLLIGSLLAVSQIKVFGMTVGYFVPIAILAIVPKFLRRYADISNGVKRINEGDLDFVIDDSGKGELAKLAKGINGISGARALAVREELKNQKMKATLISNVSHDLKTPLTSMITYLDLLKVEGISSPNADEYVSIIDQKTRRLQRLTEDLFEAAKASSGDMKVEVVDLDLCSMVHQCIGEMNGFLEDANLQVIMEFDKEKSFVKADGNLLGRIIENLLVNTSKYALAGSRVYVNIHSENPGNGDKGTYLEIKNVSKEKLNIAPGELMERFTRGESARNTEGSGLGLTIAKDLAELMGGSLEIGIDGDLFKVALKLEPSEKIEHQG